MTMSNKNLAVRFIDGATTGTSANMCIIGDALYSYGTIIAQRLDDRHITYNPSRYSLSTTRQQADLRAALHDRGFACEADHRTLFPHTRTAFRQYDHDFLTFQR